MAVAALKVRVAVAVRLWGESSGSAPSVGSQAPPISIGSLRPFWPTRNCSFFSGCWNSLALLLCSSLHGSTLLACLPARVIYVRRVYSLMDIISMSDVLMEIFEYMCMPSLRWQHISLRIQMSASTIKSTCMYIPRCAKIWSSS